MPINSISTKVTITVTAAVVLLSAYSWAQSDGNPQGWDRIRRCDADYVPLCEPCEGVGGIPYGDENDQIDLASCSVIGTPEEIDEDSLVSPEWGQTFQYVGGYSEVLIGPQLDFFCFKVFPGPTSEGKLCYRPETGDLYYDMEEKMALQLDLNVKVRGIPFFNISSTAIHNENNMWIANTLFFGVEQCVCVGFKNLWPLQPDWTKTASFVGREKILVEYLWNEMMLDHWIIGPHHFWSLPSTGELIRMWQPWNGLEVLDPDKRETLSKSIEYPPEMCKKGGALFRINCDDDGYPATCSADECNWDTFSPTVTPIDQKEDGYQSKVDYLKEDEVKRAHQRVPGPDYRGEHAAHSWSVLNNHLRKKYSFYRECEDWTINELQELQLLILNLMNETFDKIYTKNKDNRQLLHKNIQELTEEWKTFQQVQERDAHNYDSSFSSSRRIETMDTMHKAGYCAETVMWFIHHLSDSARDDLLQSGVQVPLLDVQNHECPLDASNYEQKVCSKYEQQVTCATCHSKP